MADRRRASERDRYWLEHEAAVVASGKTAKEYAAEQGLSLHAFYQARKRLRAMGLLAGPSGRPAKRSKAKSPAFTKVEKLPAVRPSAGFCLRLPNGLRLEWSSSEPPQVVAELAERLVQIR